VAAWPPWSLFLAYLHVDCGSAFNWFFNYRIYVMSYPQTQVIQRNLFAKEIVLEFIAFCNPSIHQIGD
jgi:hypothetical protein